ncbi:flagellar hook assembly protein FlgD [Thalassospira profundimaris]|uniref:flagellar hook assembly protein FlgD n=1 Tax=Thalassospira profundimaris TaxID=502049 RepID=UPI000DEDC55A|nr:flagellar hook capping FlgD N-terminal domain-containing protein [Thalassospira profundimaris]
MTVSSMTNIGLQGTNANAASSRAAQSLSQNFDSFLTLLTTQLKNQDPTSPMDSDKFTDQLSQFAQVEQGIQTNKNLENLLTMQGQQRQLSALSYVGAQIEAVGDTNWYTPGEPLNFKYSISPQVPAAKISVVDQNGKTVYAEEVKNIEGVQNFTWKGQNNSGDAIEDEAGAYTLKVQPLSTSGEPFKDKKGNPAQVSIGVVGKVDSVDIGDTDIYLRIGDVSVPFATLTNVKLASSATGDEPGTGGTDGTGGTGGTDGADGETGGTGDDTADSTTGSDDDTSDNNNT